MNNDKKPPNPFLKASEPFRALFELGSTAVSSQWRELKGTGDGHSVLVIPGLLTNDATTFILREFLKNMGYKACRWEQGFNPGVRESLFNGAVSVLKRIHAESDQKVTLIGHSLGGIYAREIAKLNPEFVRQVITLGSPFGDINGDYTNVKRVYEFFNPDDSKLPPQLKEARESMPIAPPVPTSALYSKKDGVCHWQSCMQVDGHKETENIEVEGSHLGMVANPEVMFVLADRLGQKEGLWKPFPGNIDSSKQ